MVTKTRRRKPLIDSVNTWLVKNRLISTIAALAGIVAVIADFTGALSKLNSGIATLRGPKVSLQLEKFDSGLFSFGQKDYIYVRPTIESTRVQQIEWYIPRAEFLEDKNKFVIKSTSRPPAHSISLGVSGHDLGGLCYHTVQERYSQGKDGLYICSGELPVVLRIDFVDNESPETDWSLYEIDYKVPSFLTQTQNQLQLPPQRTNFLNFRLVRRLLPWEFPDSVLAYQLRKIELKIFPPQAPP